MNNTNHTEALSETECTKIKTTKNTSPLNQTRHNKSYQTAELK